MYPRPFVWINMRVVADLDVRQDGGARVAHGNLDGPVHGGASLQVAEEQTAVERNVTDLHKNKLVEKMFKLFENIV